MRVVRRASRRVTGRFVRLASCLSILVPHNSTHLVGTIIGGTGIPIVRAKTKGYRLCISGSTRFSVTRGVIIGTGYRHPSIYGTTRGLLVRRSITRGFLPHITRTLRRQRIRLHNSRQAYTVLNDHYEPTAIRS